MPYVNKLHARNTVESTYDFSILVQAMNIGEPITTPTPFYLLEHPEGTVLFDTGMSHDLIKNPESYGRYGAPHLAPYTEDFEITDDLKPLNQLEDIGYSPSEVDFVILSHLHFDHGGNIKEYPNAEFIVHRSELEFAWSPLPAHGPFYQDGDIGVLQDNDGYNVTEVHGKYDLFGDGTIETIPTPGHSPGHQSLKVELENTGTVILMADAVHHRIGYNEELLTAVAHSMEDGVASIRKIKHLEKKEDALVSIFHDPDDWEEWPDPPGYFD